MTAVTALLSLTGVTAFYGAIQALTGVDLTVEPGEIVTLIGANGAGKSTLMMTICGSPQRARRPHHPSTARTSPRWPTHAIMRRGIAQAPEGRRIFRAHDGAREPADGRRGRRPHRHPERCWSRSSPCSRA